jgi:hypothetical protein
VRSELKEKNRAESVDNYYRIPSQMRQALKYGKRHKDDATSHQSMVHLLCVKHNVEPHTPYLDSCCPPPPEIEATMFREEKIGS